MTIKGTVVDLRALVAVTLLLPNHADIAVECVVDTGFEGALTLPADAVAVLNLPFYQEIYANLADNSDVTVDAHRATIVWGAEEINVAVIAMGRRPLIGTALLAGKRFVADIVDNGLVTFDNL